jgi:hypothetical protein
MSPVFEITQLYKQVTSSSIACWSPNFQARAQLHLTRVLWMVGLLARLIII